MLENFPFPLAFVPALHMALNGKTRVPSELQ